MKRAYTDIAEGQIHYRTEGTGPPLLLLHQSVCSSDEYSRVIPILSKTYRAIAMDMMGFGDSDKPPRKWEMRDYARSVVSFLDSLGIDKASVVGHHTGASIAVELASAYPERVEKLVLVSCPLNKERNSELLPNHLWPQFFDALQIKADGSHLMRAWQKADGISGKGSPEIVNEIALEYIKAGPRGEECHWLVMPFDAKSRLPLIKCPTLVLGVREDLFFPLFEEVKNLIPQSKGLIIEGSEIGANVVRKKSEVFAKAVIDFLQNPV